MRSAYPTIRHRIEFAALRSLVQVLRLFSPRGSRRLASILGHIGFAVMNHRRDVACQNIRRANITSDETEVRRIARAAMVHFITIAISSLQSIGGKPEKYTIIEEIDPDALKVLQDRTKGVLLCAGHLGNWEVGLQAVARTHPLLGIARRMNNPLTEDFLQWRENANIEITPKHDQDAQRLLRAIGEGRNLGLLFDQHANQKRGVMVPFFGIPASTYPSPAMLHLTTKAPICFCVCTEVSPGTYRLRIDAPFIYQRTGNRKADTLAILTELNRRLEQAIRLTPEQYLWGHRRWREDQTK
ncbi:MAG: lysophospholipid acyltransferase family protein [Kiritimatiellia bacterium]